MPAPPTSKQQQSIKSPANTKTYGSGTSTEYGGRASTSGTSGSYGGKSTTSSGGGGLRGTGGGGSVNAAAANAARIQSARTGTGGGGLRSLPPSPVTQQARLNMMSASDKTGLPGSRGTGVLGGTLPGSSPRSQLTTAVALGGAMADKYGLSPSDSIEYMGRIAKTIMGEAANQGELGQGVVAKSMFNRMNLGAKYGNRGQYTTDPMKMLRAYDANGLRPGTRVNSVYTDTQPGTDAYASGLLAAARGMSPYGLDPNIPQDFTHYRTTSMGAPYWEKKAQTTKIGDHVFSNPDYSATKVRAASPMGATLQPASYAPGPAAAAPPAQPPSYGGLGSLFSGVKSAAQGAWNNPQLKQMTETINSLPGTPDQKSAIVKAYATGGKKAAAGQYIKALFSGGGGSPFDYGYATPQRSADERGGGMVKQAQAKKQMTGEQKLQTLLLEQKQRDLLDQYMDKGMTFEQAMEVLRKGGQTASFDWQKQATA